MRKARWGTGDITSILSGMGASTSESVTASNI